MINQWLNTIQQGDCLELMEQLPDGCVDMILCDLPYGTTQNPWDSVLPFEELWRSYKRIAKPNAAIVLTASQPFTTHLIMSNLEMFKYELIWEKTKSTGFLDSSYRPLRSHENILVFYREKPTFNPQKTKGEGYVRGKTKRPKSSWGDQKESWGENVSGDRHPRSVIKIANPNNDSLHPTEKPIALFSYLIQAYTNLGDVVLDNCMGSGTTARAAKNLGRNFIGMEISPEYCEVARKRLEQEVLL